MIRRDAQFSDFAPPGWLLIDQQDHARIAAELFAVLPAETDEDTTVAQVILRHDDGWRTWDALPSCDVSAGRPYDFLEMPRSDQSEIWSRSVELGHDLGPLGQFMIAEHFLLLRRASQSGSPRGRRARDSQSDFVTSYSDNAQQWLQQWIRQGPAERSADRAAAHVAKLKWFDNVSLWLCCAHRSEPWSTLDYAGKPIVFEPLLGDVHDSTDRAGSPNDGMNDAPDEIRVHPWPFVTDQLTVATSARFLPRQCYQSLESLQTSLVGGRRLSWRLLPDH